MVFAIIYKIKKKPIPFLLIKLLFFLLIVYIFDFSLGKLLNYYYFKQESGFQYRTTYSIEKTKADLLVFGSSRANHHYYPDIFENRLNLTYYNVGRDGNFIFYHYAILKGVLKRYSPKIVILDFVFDEFKQNSKRYDRISSLLPYYNTHPEIHSIIELKSPYEKYKLLSKIYPFNSSVFSIAIGNTESNKNKWKDVKGYVPLNKTWTESIRIDSNFDKYEVDSNAVECYENFIKDCNNKGIELHIIVSPYYIISKHPNYSVIIGQEIAKKYNIKFYDFSNDSIFTSDGSLFANVDHLNDNGAKLFTNLVVDRMIIGK